MGVGGQLEVPEFVGVDLTQTEPCTVGDQPRVGALAPDIDGLAADVLGLLWRLNVLPRSAVTAVGLDRVIE